jgi:hypothetical protein
MKYMKDNDFMKFMEDTYKVKFVDMTPKKKTKKVSRSSLKTKADKLWSLKIRSKNNGLCEICGSVGNQPHHIVGRKNLTLRHDLRNGCLLCFTHHNGGNLSAHNDPLWFQTWLVKYRREDYNYLFKKRTELSTQVDYEKAIKELS